MKLMLPGEFVYPTAPSFSGFGPEHNSPTAALPVPAGQGPVLSLISTPNGPRSQSVGDKCWPNPPPDEQC